MAMICVKGKGECTGCMSCYEHEEKKLYCPVCGRRINYDEQVYIDKQSDEILGCERCVKIEYAESLEDRF